MAVPLPPRNIFDGTAAPLVSVMKTNFGLLRDFIASLSGTTGVTADAQAALQIDHIANAGGPADAITAVYSPTVPTLTDGMPFAIRAVGPNLTTTPTLAVDSTGAIVIVKGHNLPLAIGDIPSAGYRAIFRYDATLTKYVLMNPATGISGVVASNFQNKTYEAFTTTGTSTAFVLTPTPAITALATSQEFSVTFHTAPSGTPTLAVSGLTAKNLKYTDQTGAKQTLTATQAPSGWTSRVRYDGTDYVARDVPQITSVAALSTASGSAPSYSARAWVNFNGVGAVAIRASGNISSITDNGTGDYTVNFTTAMSDASYATLTNVEPIGGFEAQGNSTVRDSGTANGSSTTGFVRVRTGNAGNSFAVDFGMVSVAVFR